MDYTNLLAHASNEDALLQLSKSFLLSIVGDPRYPFVFFFPFSFALSPSSARSQPLPLADCPVGGYDIRGNKPGNEMVSNIWVVSRATTFGAGGLSACSPARLSICPLY